MFLLPHNRGLKKCTIEDCEKEFDCVGLRKAHEKDDHVHACVPCNKVFKSPAVRKTHIYAYHKHLSYLECKKISTGYYALRKCWKLVPTPTRTLAEIFKHWRIKLTNLLLSFISEFVQSKNYKFKVKINK